MPKDKQGREITGITSALTEKQKAEYGDKTRGGLSDEQIANVFGDIEPEEPVVGSGNGQLQPQPPQAPAPEPTPQILTKSVDQQVTVTEPEPTTPEGETGEPTEPGEPQKPEEPLPEGAQKVELEQAEYDHLNSLSKDDLIAKLVSHRKGKSTFQSQLAKLENVVGQPILEAVKTGEDLTMVSRLLSDLPDPAFQKHVAEFYDEHSMKDDGTYERVKDRVPAPDVLAKFAELNMKLANLNVISFMPQETEFDANEAMTNPASVSGQAMAKMRTEESKINKELTEIIEKSTQTHQAVKADPEGIRQARLLAWDNLVESNPQLQKPGEKDKFKAYVQEKRNNLLEVLYESYKRESEAQKQTKTLILREIDTVAKNKQSVEKPKTGVSTDTKKAPKDYDESQEHLIKADADYFGDM